jgi:hypothetical protein
MDYGGGLVSNESAAGAKQRYLERPGTYYVRIRGGGGGSRPPSTASSDDQYAFLRGKSTLQAAVIKRLLLERARHYGVPVCAVDADLYKAYDSVDRWVKEIALRRLGLGYEFIDFLLEFDRRNVQVVRTAYGDSEELACERGTAPQGGVESCLVFVAVRDWMFAVVHAASEKPVRLKVDDTTDVDVAATIFADDVALYQADVDAAQQVARGLDLFCLFRGMRISISKSRVLVVNGAEGEVRLQVWQAAPGWEAVALREEPIPSQRPEEYSRYLGMVQTAEGDIDEMLEGLTVEIAEAAEVLARSRITLEGAVYLCNVVLMPVLCIASNCRMPLLSRLTECKARCGGCWQARPICGRRMRRCCMAASWVAGGDGGATRLGWSG